MKLNFLLPVATVIVGVAILILFQNCTQMDPVSVLQNFESNEPAQEKEPNSQTPPEGFSSIQLDFQDQLLFEGLSGFLMAQVNIKGADYSFQWFKKGALIQESKKQFYEIENVTKNHGGSYTVKVLQDMEVIATKTAAISVIPNRQVNQPSLDCQSLPAKAEGALGNPTGKALGGGKSYRSWVARPSIQVTSRSDLVTALEQAKSGDIVYVSDEAEIDLTGLWELPIRSGVTLSSGRGREGSLGALLYTQDDTEYGNKALFHVSGDDARITGLRIRGPMSDKLPPPEVSEGYDSRGIRITGENVEIDNNDIWNFSRSVILIHKREGIHFVHVHHNYIHHSSRMFYHPDCDRRNSGGAFLCGISYGVSVGNVKNAIIEANIFSHHRHAINGGSPNTNYEARYNLVLKTFYSHPFDVHGICQSERCEKSCLWPDQSCSGYIAGEKILVHQNTFLNSGAPAVKIRAKPQKGARIACNRFQQNRGDAVIQSGIPEEYQLKTDGNVELASNYFESNLEPFVVIREAASGKYLVIDPDTGAVELSDSFSSINARWRLTQDNDSFRIQTLENAKFYDHYLFADENEKIGVTTNYRIEGVLAVEAKGNQTNTVKFGFKRTGNKILYLGYNPRTKRIELRREESEGQNWLVIQQQ